MVKKFSRVILLILAASYIVGCASENENRTQLFHDKSNDYLTSKIYPPLKTPKGLANPMYSQQYPLPDVLPEPNADIGKIDLEPPGFGKEL